MSQIVTFVDAQSVAALVDEAEGLGDLVRPDVAGL
jgi:hypothetical protein